MINKIVSLPASRFAVVPLGVDAICIRDQKQAANDDQINLLYVGNLMESKGVQHVIKSLPLIKDRYEHDVRLRIVGDGSYKGALQSLIERLHLSNSVEFYYKLSREELNRLYRESDCFVFLSYCECYGLVVAEALSKGLPVIVSDTAALSEFLHEPGCFGVKYPPDPEELAKLVVDIFRNKVVVGPFSSKIRTWDRISDDYETIYEDAIRKYSLGSASQSVLL